MCHIRHSPCLSFMSVAKVRVCARKRCKNNVSLNIPLVSTFRSGRARCLAVSARLQLDNSSLSSMSGEWPWTERLEIKASTDGVRKAPFLKIILAGVITKMQRWLSRRWMSSFLLLSALFLSPAGRNLPILLRTSTKYDQLQRKPVSARSDHHRWVIL